MAKYELVKDNGSKVETIVYAHTAAVSAWNAIYVENYGALIAHDDYDANESGVYYVKGRFRGNITSGVTVAHGSKLFHDVTAGTILLNSSTALVDGDFFLGRAVKAGTAAGGYAEFDLNEDFVKPFSRAFYQVEDLGANADISARPIFIAPDTGCELISIGILTAGAPAGVDDSNTSAITIADNAGTPNTIVTKTYNTATQPPTSDYESLGTLSATHKILAPEEHITLSITNGTTANLPVLSVVIVYQAF